MADEPDDYDRAEAAFRADPSPHNTGTFLALLIDWNNEGNKINGYWYDRGLQVIRETLLAQPITPRGNTQ